MLSLLPIAFFIIIFLIFQNHKADESWRVSFLKASLVWGIVLTGITELFSLFRLIGFWEVLGAWTINVFLALIFLFRIKNYSQRKISLFLVGMPRFDLFLLIGIVFIVVTVGFIAWLSPPNTWDAMTYHMSRVMHWIQDRSVAYYPTYTLRQLHQNPWAEFAILHFQILSGSDRLANLIQWYSMLGSILSISLIAKELGASARGQIFASVIGATIPMGILQGSSTQNDYAVSFWLVCFLYFAMLLKKNGESLDAVAMGTSLGLAILTKATAYTYAFPFIVWVGVSLINSFHIRGLWLILLTGTMVIAINFGHYARNYDLYANPLGPGDEGKGHKYSNDIFTIPAVTSNLIRNLGLHIGTPFQPVNSFMENKIYKLHRWIGIDPNDPRTTWPDTEFHVRLISLHEDTAGNLLHLILMIVTLPLIVLQQYKQKDSVYYLLCLVGAVLLFSLYVKWQPWHSRLHLPFFVLWSPLLGISISQIRFHSIANILIAILLVGALPYVLNNRSRPILGQESILTISRTELYFRNRPSIVEPYMSSTQFLLGTNCTEIGLIFTGDDWEYPFWFLLQGDKQKIHIEHVNVTNISQVKSHEFPFNAFTPCAIIVVSNKPPEKVQVNDIVYSQKMFSKPVSVFMHD